MGSNPGYTMTRAARQSCLMRSLGFKRVAFDSKTSIIREWHYYDHPEWHYYDHPSGVCLCLNPDRPKSAKEIMTAAIKRAVVLTTRTLEEQVNRPMVAMRNAATDGKLAL